MIQEVIQILLVEENTDDALLIERQIQKKAPNSIIKSVYRFDDFIIALENFNPDIILSEFTLNGFCGIEILKFINNSSNPIPLLFITGAINDEELATNSILSGATGYLLKKNIKNLDKQLLPYFQKIIDNKKNIPISNAKALRIEELQDYLEKIKRENAVNTNSYNEIKKALDRLVDLLN